MINSKRAWLTLNSVRMLACAALCLVGFSPMANAALPLEKVGRAEVTTAAALLQARYLALRPQLAANAFLRPLVLESVETSNELRGDAYSVVPHAFSKVRGELAKPQVWCDILSLHLNTKYCRPVYDAATTTLLMNVGKKYDQPLESSHRLTFAWRLAAQNADYLQVGLSADNGPLGTHGYRIAIEAVPLEDGSTFVHLSYSYGFGWTSRVAMTAYLGTIGRDKVGFTLTASEDGSRAYVSGMRGLIERNTVRYQLAIESFFGAVNAPSPTQFEKRINDWFDASERYPRQLHEMERDDYLEMKRREFRRQQPE